MSLKRAVSKALDNVPLSDADIRAVLDAIQERPAEVLSAAQSVRQKYFYKDVGLCAIVNAKSGACSEDCAFCAQSSKHKTDAPHHAMISGEDVGLAAERAKKWGVTRFSPVMSGKLVGERDFQGMVDGVKAVVKAGLVADISPGILDRSQIQRLISAGLSGYHHNLETSAEFFVKVCTTHAWQEDYEAVERAKAQGLYTCSGGIFGIGESWEDRVSLALSLKKLGVDSVPLNFLQPVPGTRLEHQPVLQPGEAQAIIALYRLILPDRAIRVCGGRPAVFGEDAVLPVLAAGASGIMTGDYLTTKGRTPEEDVQEMRDAGYSPEILE